MKKVLFALVCATVIFSSCGDSAVKVNDAIVNGVDGTVGTMEKVMDYIQHDDYTNAKAYLDSATIQATKATEIISKLDNKSAEEFKQSALELLKMVSTEAPAAYTQAMELYQTATDNNQMEKANNLINDFIDKAQKQQDDVKQKQEEFAKKNNITLY